MNIAQSSNEAYRFTQLIGEKLREIKGGQKMVVIFNGIDTITLWSDASLVVRSEQVSCAAAAEIEAYLKEKEFQIRKFRISKNAFEAIARKPRIHYR